MCVISKCTHSACKQYECNSHTSQVNTFLSIAGCLVNSDIFFVLDVSASIGKENFTKIQKFEHDFVQNLTIGPNDNQVGTIIFDHNATTVFKLNDYNNTECVLNAINKIPFRAKYTNVKDALCRLKEGYQCGNGARNLSRSVFRIAIVLSDGMSNHCESDCGWYSIDEAAAAMRDLGVLVYVIAVGRFDYSELEKIASRVPGAVTKLEDFNLTRGQEKIFDDVCKRGKHV